MGIEGGTLLAWGDIDELIAWLQRARAMHEPVAVAVLDGQILAFTHPSLDPVAFETGLHESYESQLEGV